MKMLALALVSAFTLGFASPDAKAANSVPIELRSFGFNPSPIDLHAGTEVTLVFSNSAGISHEFKAPEFFRAAKIVSGKIDDEGSVELKPHTSASVTLIPARGTYAAHCGHFMHAQMGMRSVINVQ